MTLPFIPYNRKNKDYAKTMRRKMTRGEKIMRFDLLKQRPLGYKFIRQKMIGSYILDFYCSKLLLCIEIDGSSHYGREAYDARRTRVLNGLGIKVVRYTNKAVYRRLRSIEIDLQAVLLARRTQLEWV